MSDVEQAIRDLVIANRVLAHEGVVDAYGHVSIRHPRDPGRYLLSRSRSPELVRVDDIMEFTLDSKPTKGDTRPPYLERFIHGAIYAARPEVMAVVHAHSEAVLPFGITDAPFRPVIHSASDIGGHVPVWDIEDAFGDATDLMVTNEAQGRDLAKGLAANQLVLMRGHGFAAAARSLFNVVRLSVNVPRNARVLLSAQTLGKVKGLSKGELATRSKGNPMAPASWRGWEYWAKRAGVGELLAPYPEDARDD